MDSGAFLSTLMAFFAIMNPIANTPVFLGLTDGLEPSVQKKIAIRGLLIAFGIITVFALSGNAILNAFGITLEAFRIAGGILIGLVGYHMLNGNSSRVHSPNEEAGKIDSGTLDLATSPLALPILAGPGTITTAMSFSHGSIAGGLLVTLAFAVICAVTLGFFLAGEKLVSFLGNNAIQVVTRLMGLILLVIGVQMLIEGIQGVDWSGKTIFPRKGA
ncbi:MAG: MarC family protein [Verrucomicrobiota bacterium]